MKATHSDRIETIPDASTQLSPPHFDELAVAFAQPVQPLAPRRKKKLLRSSLLLIAYLVFIVAVISVVYLAPPKARVDASTEAMTSETQTDAQSGQVDTSPAGTTENDVMGGPAIEHAKKHSRRVSTRLHFPNQTIQIVEGGEGKPVARKVGEIRYGRSSDRP